MIVEGIKKKRGLNKLDVKGKSHQATNSTCLSTKEVRLFKS